MENSGERPDFGVLEERVGELERIADSLGGVPDEDLAGVLEDAARLVGEINARLEAGIRSTEAESREVSALLEGVDFALFDEAMESLEQRERAEDSDAAP